MNKVVSTNSSKLHPKQVPVDYINAATVSFESEYSTCSIRPSESIIVSHAIKEEAEGGMSIDIVVNAVDIKGLALEAVFVGQGRLVPSRS